MATTDNVLLKRLLAIFKIEAQEHVDAMASGLVEMEKATIEEEKAGFVETIFRHAHSLKGAARAVNATSIGTICHSLESVFAALKNQQFATSTDLFDVLHGAIEVLGECVGFTESEPPASLKPRLALLLTSLQSVLAGKLTPKPRETIPTLRSREIPPTNRPEVAVVEDKREVTQTVRVSTAKLDALLLQTEELLLAKQVFAQQMAKLRQIQSTPSQWKKKWVALRSDVRSVERFLERTEEREQKIPAEPQMKRIAEFLDWNRSFMEALELDLHGLSHTASRDQRTVGRMVDDLLGEMKTIVMQPFSKLLDVLPRMVRELSRELGKEVKLTIQGDEIEVARQILEEMKDPLIHLVRNTIDHGIEKPADRVSKDKPPCGTIAVNISAKEGGKIELLIADDGQGIDAGKVKAAAVKLQLLSAEKTASLGETDILPFIFQPGISTSPMITDISGRGLGLAIVREKVEKLNGTLVIETEPGKGTTFRVTLPLTVAHFHGVIIRLEEHLFVLPTRHVERVTRVRNNEVKTVANRQSISVNGRPISLVRLHELLNVNRAQAEGSEFLFTVILHSANTRLAVVVDEILQEQEILVKTLGPHLTRVRNIAGATVLGNGRVVPILDIPDLVASALQAEGTGSRTPQVATYKTKRKSILVAEDSITSRTLLKNILEAAGYRVETSVDGFDALSKLRSGQFDLVVSDVDMPRMNGFGLTAKIRADKKFSEIPVILVTSLDSPADREHGIDVGASAYIVKASFDQSNLLEVIGRLI